MDQSQHIADHRRTIPAHTPGPWADSEGTTTGRIVTAPGQPKVRRNVAACGGPNREANARLIASAPDLLVALEAFDAFMRKAEEGHTEGWFDRNEDERTLVGLNSARLTIGDFRAARAAIAKARGASA